MIPYNNETRQQYIDRANQVNLEMAERHCELGHDLTMYQYLLNIAMAEEIYGTHWDKINKK